MFGTENQRLFADWWWTNTLLNAVHRGFVYRNTFQGACRWAARELYGPEELEQHAKALQQFYLEHADPVDLADL